MPWKNFSDDFESCERTTPSFTNFDVKLVEEHPILEVAIKTVGLLNQQSTDAGMLLEVIHHLVEIQAAACLRRLHVDKFFLNDEAVPAGIGLQELLLRGDGKSLHILLFGGDARISQHYI